MKTIPNKFGVRVTSEDFNSGSYFSPTDCPLARALIRRFPNIYISVGGQTANIGNRVYNINIDDSTKLVTRTCVQTKSKGTNIRLMKF